MAFNLPIFFKQRKQDINNVDRNGRNAEFDSSSAGGGGGASVKHQLNWVQPNGFSSRSQQTLVRSPSPSFLSATQKPNSRAPSPQASALEAEELDENPFYLEVDQRFSYIFLRVSVLCVPHTWSIGGLEIDKDFVGESSHHFLFMKSSWVATQIKIRSVTRYTSVTAGWLIA